MDEALVEKADDQAGLASHGGVDGIAGERSQTKGVLAIRGAAPDLVARVEIPHDDGDPLRMEARKA